MNKYKVGDKIILTVSDVNEKAYYSYYVFNNNDLILWEPSTDKYAEPLSTYTEPLSNKVADQRKEINHLLRKIKEKEAEIERLEDELRSRAQKLTWQNGVEAGQNEAWELARKIFDMETNDIEDIFIKEDAWNLGTVLNNYTYPEAAAKVAEWEKAKEEIKVGDVLEDMASGKVKCVVTNIYPSNMAYLVFNDGSAGMHELENMKKTGRHIDIDSFLKQIGGE